MNSDETSQPPMSRNTARDVPQSFKAFTDPHDAQTIYDAPEVWLVFGVSRATGERFALAAYSARDLAERHVDRACRHPEDDPHQMSHADALNINLETTSLRVRTSLL